MLPFWVERKVFSVITCFYAVFNFYSFPAVPIGSIGKFFRVIEIDLDILIKGQFCYCCIVFGISYIVLMFFYSIFNFPFSNFYVTTFFIFFFCIFTFVDSCCFKWVDWISVWFYLLENIWTGFILVRLGWIWLLLFSKYELILYNRVWQWYYFFKFLSWLYVANGFSSFLINFLN